MADSAKCEAVPNMAPIAAEHALLRNVFECIPEPLILLDEAMRILRINRAARKYYGIAPDTPCRGLVCFDLFFNRSTACRQCRIPAAVADRTFLCFERSNPTDLQKVDQVNIYPVFDHTTGAGCSLVRIKNITDLKNEAKENSRTDKLIALGALVSGVAHETNNPNNLIMMNIQLIQDAWQNIAPILQSHYHEHGDFDLGGLPYMEMRRELPELMRGIVDGSQRIEQIIKGLKRFSREDECCMDEAVNVNQAIENALAFNRKLIDDTTDRFARHLHPDLPAITGNRHQIEQVLINLITNACQATTRKDQEIAITSGLDSDAKQVLISVSDRGSGIPANLLHKIMNPFFTTRRHAGGTGLGLSISAKIVKKHGGSLHAANRPAGGASFQIKLPLHLRQDLPRILIVDDDPGARRTIELILKRAGRFDLHSVGNGTEALFAMGLQKPDVIILDIHMANMDGVEVCRLIKKRPELTGIAVIVTTGFANTGKALKINQMGFGLILEKPIAAKRLLRALDAALDTKR